MTRETTLFLSVDYDAIMDKFCYRTNIQRELLSEIVTEFLRSQMGGGEDNSEPEEHDLYEIDIDLDLSGDIFKSGSNCGNLGLRDGILAHFLIRISG